MYIQISSWYIIISSWNRLHKPNTSCILLAPGGFSRMLPAAPRRSQSEVRGTALTLGRLFFFPCLPTDRVKITCVNYGNTEIGHINAWLIPTVAHVLLWQGGGIKHREDECIPCVAQSQTRSFMLSCKRKKSCSRSNIYGMWGYHRTTSGMNM